MYIILTAKSRSRGYPSAPRARVALVEIHPWCNRLPSTISRRARGVKGVVKSWDLQDRTGAPDSDYCRAVQEAKAEAARRNGHDEAPDPCQVCDLSGRGWCQDPIWRRPLAAPGEPYAIEVRRDTSKGGAPGKYVRVAVVEVATARIAAERRHLYFGTTERSESGRAMLEAVAARDLLNETAPCPQHGPVPKTSHPASE